MKRTIIFSLFFALLLGLAAYFLLRKKPTEISCNKNVGPFANVSEPRINKSDLRMKIYNFYELCLKPQYENGYVTSPNNGNSESQSYALLQAFLASDKKTFQKILDWTNENIKRPNDNLFAWKFDVVEGKAVISDQNSATDADTDIAYALFLAGAEWSRPEYVRQAKLIINDIWNIETVEINNKRYVTAGPWANEPNSIVINPSYISPQAYRVFSYLDPEHDWNKLIADSYGLLTLVSLRTSQVQAIPPNWIRISKTDSNLSMFDGKSDSLDFSYDAFRTFWRVGLDQLNNPSSESWNFISSVKQYENDWNAEQEICSLYIFRNGGYDCDHSTTGTLAAPIGVFSVTNGFLAAQVIQKYYIKDDLLEFPDTDFYAQSWHWFGSWLWANS